MVQASPTVTSQHKMQIGMEDKLAYISGFSLTTLMTMQSQEMIMALILGIIGGFGGLIGKQIFYIARKIWTIRKNKKS